MRANWNGTEWTCHLELPAWEPFLDEDASGAIEVAFASVDGSAPGPEQLETLRMVSRSQCELKAAVVSALRAYYDRVRPKYLGHLDDPSTDMPDRPSDAEFARLHKLQSIFVHSVAKASIAYVGFSFHARWELEHGLGVLTHGSRVVEVGGAETSFLEWLAERDASHP